MAKQPIRMVVANCPPIIMALLLWPKTAFAAWTVFPSSSTTINPDVMIVLGLAVESEVVKEVKVLVVTVKVEVGVTVMVLVELVLMIEVDVTGLLVLTPQMIMVVQPLHWHVFGLTVMVLVGVTVVVLVGVTVVVLVGVTVIVLVGVTVMVLVGVTVVVLVGVTVVVLVPVVIVVVMVPVALELVVVLVGSGRMFMVRPLISTKVQPYKQNSKLTRLMGINVGMVQL